MSNTELPPLPDRYTIIGFHDVYTADQMRAYARAALAQPAASGEPVAHVSECEACFTPDACQLRGTCDHYAAEKLRIAAAPQPAPARVPPEDWSVFNSGALVADGLSYADAIDYLTPERLRRDWSAVCVATKDNIVDAAPGAPDAQPKGAT